MIASVRAYAKLNLYLAVTGAKDGYHEIESLMQSIDLFDEVTLSTREDCRFTSDFPGDNALVVLEKLAKTFGTGGADITTEKHIPIGGGLGGSAADAAAAALAYARLYKLDERSAAETVAPLFGDLAFQMTGGTAIARGFGDRIEPLPPLPPYYVLLVFPVKGVSTAEAYRLSDAAPKGKGDLAATLSTLARRESAQAYYRNDLLLPAMQLNAEITPLLSEMRDESALLTGMSGSGSTLFSLYADSAAAEKKAKSLSARTLVSQTIPALPRKEVENALFYGRSPL